MTAVSIVGPGEGEDLALGPVRMRILETGATTAHRLGISEITVPPHTDGPPQHRHAEHDEGFYVVSGTGRFTVGTEVRDAGPGTLAMVPTGAPHTFANPGDEPLVLLNTFTPDLYVPYFREMHDLWAATSPPDPGAVAGIMARYATEPATEYATDPAPDPAGASPGADGPRDVRLADGTVLRVDHRGPATGRPFLLLHGGGGPSTMRGLAEGLAAGGARVLTPTMPGFDGTDRPAGCATPADVAGVYLRLLGEVTEVTEVAGLAGLTGPGVTVVGSSAGGWVAAEMALRDTAGRVGRLVLLDAVGILDPDHPITDVSALPPERLAALAFADPARFAPDPAALPPQAVAARSANAAVFADYAGDPYMHDPGLRDRLAAVTVPARVVWGAQDGVVTPAYGRAFARALGDAEFVVVDGAGHLPQVERADLTRALVAG